MSSKTVKEYFQVLVDTLLGVFVEPFSHRRSRAVITSAPRRTNDGIRILPWERFLERLWGDRVVA